MMTNGYLWGDGRMEEVNIEIFIKMVETGGAERLE